MDCDDLIREIEIRPLIYDKSEPSYKNSHAREAAWLEIARRLRIGIAECRRRWSNLRGNFAKQHKSVITPGKNFGIIKNEWTYYRKLQFLTRIVEETWNHEPASYNEDAENETNNPVYIGFHPDAYLEEIVHHRSEIMYSPSKHCNNSPSPPNSPIAVEYPDVDPKEEDTTDFVEDNADRCLVEYSFNNAVSDEPSSSSGNKTKKYSSLRKCLRKRRREELDAKTFKLTKSGNDDQHNTQFLLSLLPTLKRLTPRQNAIARMKINQVLYMIEFENDDNYFIIK